MNVNIVFHRLDSSLHKIDGLKNIDSSNSGRIKKLILENLDECQKIIKQSFNQGNLDELKEIRSKLNQFTKKANKERLTLVFRRVMGEDLEFVEQRIDQIMKELSDRISQLEDQQSPYLDRHRLLQGAPGEQKIDPVFQDWFISQAILNEKAVETDAKTARLLHRMILQGFRKSAGFHDAKSLNVQTSPLYSSQTGYYRHDRFRITEDCYRAYARDLGVGEMPLFLIESPLLKEVFDREMPHPDLDQNIDSLLKFDQLIDHILDDYQNQRHVDQPLLLDLSSFLKKQNLKPHDLNRVINELEHLIEAKVNDFIRANKKFGRDDVQNHLSSNIQFIAFVNHKGQDVLLIPDFCGKACARYPIEEMIGRTGFRMSPSQTIKAWLKVESLEEILRKENIPTASLATEGSVIPRVFERWEDFLKHPAVGRFAALSNRSEAAPYLKVLSHSTVELLKGLSSLKIDQACANKGLNDLLQVSYYRMINAMGEAEYRKDDFVHFYNQIELIHLEIQTMLAIAAPYQKGDLEDGVIANLTKSPSIIPKLLDRPKVHLKASAMHSLASVISSVEQQKESGSLNVAVLKDSYFESSSLFQKAQNYHLTMLDGDKFNVEGLQGAISDFPKEPIDLFVCEFHHNISLERQSYRPENIAEQLKAMHQKGLLAERCTIVIDTTINLERSEEIRSFLADEEIHQMIQDGILNVVLLRSTQKFDMLGLDNYYGGLTVSINKHDSFERFNSRMDHPRDQMGGFNYQGIAHLQRYGVLDSYRQAIIDNTQRLYSQLPQEIIFHEGITSPMQISKVEDPKEVFLDVKFPEFPLTGYAVNRKMIEFAKMRKLPFSTRASFGFPNTNLSTINNDIFRLNPGLEGPPVLDQYAEFFNLMHHELAREQAKVSNLAKEEQDMALAKCIRNMPLP